MKRIESIWLPENVKNVWMITFELQKVASLGGLGNAVYNMAKHLAQKGYNVTIFMPSHGRHLSEYYRSILKLNYIDLRVEGYRKGTDNNYYPYKIGFEEGTLDNFKVILVKGLDQTTGRILDTWNIYDNTLEKSALLSRGLEGYILSKLPNDVPDLIHAQDWHAVVPAVRIKQILEERKIVVPLVYTIHLLNKVDVPWHYASQDWSGIEDCNHYVWMVSKHNLYKYSYVWDSLSNGYIEKFGCYEADVVTTVSYSYLTFDVFNLVGSWIANKSCITYNGTDWDVNEIENKIMKFYETKNRRELRRRLLSSLNALRAIPDDYTTGNILWNNKNRIGIRDDWTYDNLGEGPLLLFTGRIVYQKGIDLLLRAMKLVVNEISNARLIVLGIPSGDYNLLWDIIDRASEIKDNVRLILGRIDPDLYKIYHYASSVFVIPSRWEPFGINAIEAMSLGLPVIAYAVGGLRETVVDIREDLEHGTGILVKPESIDDLAKAIKVAIYLSEASENNNYDLLTKVQDYIQIKDVNYWNKVRENSIKRVDSKFRWEAVINSLTECYKKALEMAKYRALASF
ncbi:glycogen synthase [Sulfolobus sp. A20]|uniref:glycosyltransferase n=1 Tax=Saccharolobus sp. A20 TaxID=1891280 RepID=UPI000845C330|nr:glycosyltransferase [Sulfolobus sp. A20]TRM75299.1 glycogen synthase [Sulfolobus sp. A20-N-F8]TRM88671.1 glycogen synthase [Sulfolobus sp. C3]TRM97580.1 glycogen synthase [Sulfolobus sp. F1]TRM99156.1 glycogen synthase [Sulfolobus sp. E1]AOL17596.1 glycogen synthase [Sulfolobus sp. A20]